MPYREVTMFEVKEVLRLWLAGVAKQRIAAQLGLDRKTVRHYLKAAVAAGITTEAELTDERLVTVMATLRPASGRPHGDTWSQCQRQRPFIEAKLRDGVRLSKVRRLLQRRGVRVPYPTLHRFAVEEQRAGAAGSAPGSSRPSCRATASSTPASARSWPAPSRPVKPPGRFTAGSSRS